MLYKSLKYISIAIVNLILLLTLLLLWADRLMLIFNVNEFIPVFEFIKLLGISFISLLGMRILVIYFREYKITDNWLKIKMSIGLTLLISSYFYITYSSKVIQNSIIDRRLRNGIVDKIVVVNSLETKAEHLTIIEYRELVKMSWFPQLPDEATDIEYTYWKELFLPDFSFTLSYSVPKEIAVEVIEDDSDKDYSKSQNFVIIGDKKRVTHIEEEK